jgi:ubiquinone/menaquinone biosynthesis C-methylase UbiE
MALDLESKYNDWHQNGHRHDNAESPLQFPWYETVFNHFQKDLHGKILEVGCGRGAFAIWLARQFPQLQITGVDFSPVAIAIARQSNPHLPSQLDFQVGDAQALALADSTYDFVITCECLEHVPSPPQMTKEIFRVLKPGGRFCLTTENYLNGMLLAWAHTKLTGKPFDSGSGVQPRENFFVFPMVHRLLKRTGLVIDTVQSSHYQWLLLPRTDPKKLRTEQFTEAWQRTLFKPFGRHISYFGHKPV